jgi:hypothetical protein
MAHPAGESESDFLGSISTGAGGGCLLRCSTTANDPAHRRIATEPVGVVHVLVSGDTPEHRLSQHSDQIMPTVPARASISQILPRDYHQAEHVIQLPERQQTSIRGDAGTLELQSGSRMMRTLSRLPILAGDRLTGCTAAVR